MNYKDMKVWVQTNELSYEVIRELKEVNDRNLYPLINQAVKSAVSVPSNVAEGIGRQYKKETIHFLYIARGSLYELETQLILLKKFNEIKDEKFIEIEKKTQSCRRLISGTINYLKKNKELR